MTEGPWENNGNAVHKRISPHYAECIAICEGPNRRENAAAIAALPELLKHLKHMVWLVEVELKEDGGHIVVNAKAAIAKVEGETH